jgi:hypothetical protein
VCIVYWNILSFKPCNISSSLLEISNTIDCPFVFSLCLACLGLFHPGQKQATILVAHKTLGNGLRVVVSAKDRVSFTMKPMGCLIRSIKESTN